MTSIDAGAGAPETPAPKNDRTLLVLLCVVAGFVVVALVLVLFRGGPAQLDRSTPEGVVQAYSEAVIADRYDEAIGYFGLVGDCEPIDYYAERNLRVSLRGTSIDGDRAIVRVLVGVVGSGDPFGSGYEEHSAFELRQVNGQWRIYSAPSTLTVCYFSDGR